MPEIAAKAVTTLFNRTGDRPVGQAIVHPGGRDVLQALGPIFPGDDLSESASILRQFGNMSSPSVLFALEKRLDAQPVTDDLWLTSFGAGFSCHSCRLGPPQDS